MSRPRRCYVTLFFFQRGFKVFFLILDVWEWLALAGTSGRCFTGQPKRGMLLKGRCARARVHWSCSPGRLVLSSHHKVGTNDSDSAMQTISAKFSSWLAAPASSQAR